MKLIAVDSNLVNGWSYTTANNDFYSMSFSNRGPEVMRVDVFILRRTDPDLCDDLDKTG